MTARASARERGWLRRSITRLFVAVAVVLLPLALVVAWPLDAVGDGYQLLGLLIAGIGVPVVEPWLMQRERDLDEIARKAMRFMRARRTALRDWWRRRRGGQTVTSGPVNASGKSGIAFGGGGTAELTVTRTPEAEIAILKQQVASLERARAEDAAEFGRQLAAQRDELRAHTVSVTQQGWQYILSGAACSAFGMLLALVA